eukprot:2928911-Pyramimonas_sp.AAC.1
MQTTLLGLPHADDTPKMIMQIYVALASPACPRSETAAWAPGIASTKTQKSAPPRRPSTPEGRADG